MDPLWLSIASIVFVIASVLVLRLHPFLALSSAALLVAVLTPSAQLLDVTLEDQAQRVAQVDGSRVQLTSGEPYAGRYQVYRRGDGTPHFQPVGEVFLRDGALREPASAATPAGLQAGDLILHESQWARLQVSAGASPGERLAAGFGDTCRSIGILIAMASIIGTCLLESGAARRIVEATRNGVGERHTPLAFALSGFVVGVPVFFDTVFYLLMPLAKALRLRTGRDYLLYVMAIVVGATMAHSLVPPTPGPLFVASKLGINVGTMIIAGTVVGLLSVASGFLYILWANRVWEVPLRDASDAAPSWDSADGGAAPSVLTSLLPIVIPVILLSGKTLLEARIDVLASIGQPVPLWLSRLEPLLGFFGDKNVALVLAAFVALATLARQRMRRGEANWLAGTQQALSSAGLIILITASGGAFGSALRQCGIAAAIQSRFPAAEGGLTLLAVAFVLTALVRFAQGSATVAMITSVSIVAPLMSQVTLDYHPVYLALAIGCGSKPLSWMNDSGFWIVGRMSGMTESETLKTFSVTLTIMGVVGFLVTLAGAKWLPLVTSQ